MANQKLKPRLELEMFSFVCVDLTKCKSLFSLSVLYRMTNFMKNSLNIVNGVISSDEM
jgi:hypothetical protein